MPITRRYDIDNDPFFRGLSGSDIPKGLDTDEDYTPPSPDATEAVVAVVHPNDGYPRPVTSCLCAPEYAASLVVVANGDLDDYYISALDPVDAEQEVCEYLATRTTLASTLDDPEMVMEAAWERIMGSYPIVADDVYWDRGVSANLQRVASEDSGELEDEDSRRMFGLGPMVESDPDDIDNQELFF